MAPRQINITSYALGGAGIPDLLGNMPPRLLTRIHYAFLRPEEDGLIASGFPDSESSDFEALRSFRSRNPGTKLLLSIGGWEWSTWFSSIAEDPAKHRRFVSSAIDHLKRSGFDGIDIDWEYPTGAGHEHNTRSPQDPQNFLSLCRNLRKAMEEFRQEPLLLTCALGAQPEGTRKLDLPALAPAWH